MKIRSLILGVSGFVALTAGSALAQTTQAQSSQAAHSSVQDGNRNFIHQSIAKQMSGQSATQGAAYRYQVEHSSVQEGLRG